MNPIINLPAVPTKYRTVHAMVVHKKSVHGILQLTNDTKLDPCTKINMIKHLMGQPKYILHIK